MVTPSREGTRLRLLELLGQRDRAALGAVVGAGGGILLRVAVAVASVAGGRPAARARVEAREVAEVRAGDPPVGRVLAVLEHVRRGDLECGEAADVEVVQRLRLRRVEDR